jgi:hypothetical protein
VKVAALSEFVKPRVEILSAFKLFRDFKAIESTVDGLPTPRGGLVAVTAPTGHGKTTVSKLLQVVYSRGLSFANRELTRGSVLALDGENADDGTMHTVAVAQDLGLTGEDLSKSPGHLLTIPGTFAIDYEIDDIAERLTGMSVDLVAVFVDTSAAFYGADDENDNVAMRRHASMLRELTTLPGNPTVYVLCHPTKNAQRDNLLPRGGGAFLAEVDANLTLWKDESGIVTLHWAGKIRGPSFEPIRFELVPVQLEGYEDCRGRPIWSVVARHLPEAKAEQLERREINEQDRLVIALRKWPGASVAELAREAGLLNAEGEPLKSKADRRLKTLESLQLAERNRHGKWKLTLKGQKDAEALPC